jgi:hypothetical protein
LRTPLHASLAIATPGGNIGGLKTNTSAPGTGPGLSGLHATSI